MQAVLSIKNGKHYLVLEGISNGKKICKRSNNHKNILGYIESLGNPYIARTNSCDVTLSYENGDTLILKNYKKYKDRHLYQETVSKINENTSIVKMRSMNKVKLAALALAGTVLVTTVLTYVKPNEQPEMPVLEVVEMDDIADTIIANEPESYEENVIVEISEDSLETRIEQTNKIRNGIINCSSISLASRMDNYALNKLVKCINSETGQYFIDYGEQFGVDPYILMSLSMNESSLLHKETLPGGSHYNGYGVGICQHENPNNERYITAFNYLTGEEETELLNMNSACNLEMNIKMSAMIMQDYIHRYNNNIYLALQAYNYGYQVMDILLNEYAKETNQTIEQIINNHQDLGWMKYVHDVHQNPKKYVSNWSHKTYGNANYIEDVLGYYLGIQSKNVLSDGTICYTDLSTLQNQYQETNNFIL